MLNPYKEVADELGVSEDLVRAIIFSQFKMAKDHIRNLTLEEIDNMDAIYSFYGLGRFEKNKAKINYEIRRQSLSQERQSGDSGIIDSRT